MLIKKKVQATEDVAVVAPATTECPEGQLCLNKNSAEADIMNAIKKLSAMDISNPVVKDSIANLSVVLLDLRGMGQDTIQE